MAHRVLHPAGWAKPKGYANGIEATGRQIFVGGQIGWDADQRFTADDFVGQARQALEEGKSAREAARIAGLHERTIWRMKSGSDEDQFDLF